jgi:phosphatidylserine decarboxylase
VYLLYLIPKNWLSRLVGWAVRRPWPLGLHRLIRDWFIGKYGVNVAEAEKPLEAYPTLGALFVRRLQPGARPLAAASLVSPVDGMLTQRGVLEGGADARLVQIKGLSYSLAGLLGKGWDAAAYAGGAFLTLYLAPWNYHRIHAPAQGRVLRARHIAGALWPVNAWSVERIPELFVRNDRILVEMECGGGRICTALIGATNVGRITLDFCSGLVGNSGDGIRDWEPQSP